MRKIKNILQVLNMSCHISHKPWQGCSDKQVVHLEQTLEINLPSDYVDYLMLVGLGAGSFLNGTSAFYNDLFELKKYAIELLEENNITNFLKQSDFVFSMHQGYEFIYLDTLKGNLSPIFQFVEGNNDAILFWPSFEEYLQDVVSQHIRI